MSDILIHTDGGVSTITFNRLDKKNALTEAMYSALAEAMQQAASDDAVRVLVIQGDASVFTAGNDIKDFLEHPPTSTDAPVFRFLRQLVTFPKPLIAAVAGPAVGVGTTMLFHCDLVYAGDNAAFAMPFVNLGLCPEAGSSLLAPQLVGHQRAAELLLLGEPFLAETARDIGLVNRITAPTEVNALALAQAQRLASKPMSSLLETKRLLKQGQQAALLERLAEEATVFARMLGEPAAREAFTAFMEKRAPQFH
ncbi:enoyl-CoA hydratase [Brachymonas sp. J145]|uniref:enoyl-CoA hydratase n=1 Tax=Brachymonas sp. J145 TaxID=3116489 RepID=UPI002E76F674|nr:enoyl-CoA hydratase [Brachymonas sp. J145]MEE1653427.1 enoyl-CoA hydratase [Brachymonas sp. J145]